MIRCFLTGIEMQLEAAYVLDISAASHALRDLRQRVLTLERLIEQLGEYDSVEVRDHKKGGPRVRKDRRLVSESMAQALSAACPEKKIFIPWKEWRARRPFPMAKSMDGHAGKPQCGARQADVKEISLAAATGEQ